MTNEMKRLYQLGGGALAASGVLFFIQAIHDFLAGAPPSNGPEVLAWALSRAPYLAWTSEVLFFAALLLVPGVIALYHSLVGVDRTKAATGCGIIAVVIPLLAMLLIVHGRLVYPIYGLRANTPETSALVVAIFYGGMHAVALLMAPATFILSLAMRRSTFGVGIARLGFVTSGLDIALSYPYLIGPVATLVCQAFFAAWFIAVGVRLNRMS